MQVAITTGFSIKFIYYLFGLIKNDYKVKYIFIQVNTYRYKREKNRLVNKGLSYLPKFLIKLLTYKIFNLRCSIPSYCLYKINTLLINKKGSTNIDDFISFYNSSSYTSDILLGNNFYSLLDKLKLFLAIYSQDTDIILVNDINSIKSNPILQKKYDLLILVGGTVLNRKTILQISGEIVCIHNSILPYLRGWGGAEIWALIKNIPEAIGQTVFFVTEGIDDGDILYQENISLRKDDTFIKIIERNIDNGLNVLIRSINMLMNDNPIRIKQDDSKSIRINGHPNQNQLLIAKQNLDNIINNL